MDSEDLMRKFFSMGHKIIHLPTLKISPIKTNPIDGDEYDAFVFTSANAIRNLNLKKNNKKNLCFCVGSITEKIARQTGFVETFSAGGTINALKNLILSSDKINNKSRIGYICGDNISYELDKELENEGLSVKKIINYSSEKIIGLNEENKKIIDKYPPDIIFIYSLRSAQSFIEIVKNYSLYPLMTESKVMCISKKVAEIFNKKDWKKVGIFNPGEELLEL